MEREEANSKDAEEVPVKQDPGILQEDNGMEDELKQEAEDKNVDEEELDFA